MNPKHSVQRPPINKRMAVRDSLTGIEMPIQLISAANPLLVHVIFGNMSFMMPRSSLNELGEFFMYEDDAILRGDAL